MCERCSGMISGVCIHVKLSPCIEQACTSHTQQASMPQGNLLRRVLLLHAAQAGLTLCNCRCSCFSSRIHSCCDCLMTPLFESNSSVLSSAGPFSNQIFLKAKFISLIMKIVDHHQYRHLQLIRIVDISNKSVWANAFSSKQRQARTTLQHCSVLISPSNH
jgi:hypothetical protein